MRKAVVYLLGIIAVGFAAYSILQNQVAVKPEPEAQEIENPGLSQLQDKTVFFYIAEQEPIRSIASRLQELGFIENPESFIEYADASGDARNYQAGDFRLQMGSSIAEISQSLTKAVVEQIPVTIPEGFRNIDIDNRLTELGLIDRGEFLQCVADCIFADYPFLPNSSAQREGYFFPDTYFVLRSEFAVEDFATKQLQAFVDKAWPVARQSQRSLDDVVVLASIIEKEAFTDEERPLIADIFWKRLDADWALGADATTRYGLNKMEGELVEADFQVDDPYNTRINKGLPPSAISNPGLASIQAAANPQDSEYMFFIHDEQKRIHFAKTYEQHRQNRDLYLNE